MQVNRDLGGEFQLTDWQMKAVWQAEKSLAEGGKTIPFEDVKVWMESWGTENELPMPPCQ
ncbi:MAG: hypothetical protein HQL75_09415 [Magnetococcales bacterium]|nr:hypothetical protein [Magnetococcales bacterium]